MLESDRCKIVEGKNKNHLPRLFSYPILIWKLNRLENYPEHFPEEVAIISFTYKT